MLTGPTLLTALSLAVLLGLFESMESVKPFDPGPGIGERLPSFEAVDQDGRPRTFDSLRGSQGLVLLFFRSADW